MDEKEVTKITKEKEKLEAKYNKVSRDYMINCMKINRSFHAGSVVLYSSIADEQCSTLKITASTFLKMEDRQGLVDFLELVEGYQKIMSENILDIKTNAKI